MKIDIRSDSPLLYGKGCRVIDLDTDEDLTKSLRILAADDEDDWIEYRLPSEANPPTPNGITIAAVTAHRDLGWIVRRRGHYRIITPREWICGKVILGGAVCNLAPGHVDGCEWSSTRERAAEARSSA